MAIVDGAPASASTAPGEYPGAVTCSGAHDPDYDISYATASLRVDPVISLDQRGLPGTVAHRAFLDGSRVSLPVVTQVVRYGSRHAYRFAAAVLDGEGTTYVTTEPGSDGPVVANVDVRARYRTMDQVLQQAAGARGVTHREADRLATRWDAIETLIDQHHTAKLRDALHRFATRVRHQTGETIRAATATNLLAYSQAVYRRIGGAGAV